MKTQLITTITLIALLSACGNSQGDRALSGGAIGAGVGGVGSAIVGGGVLPGAVVGGLVGAAAGGLTSKKDINLGDPAWK